MWLCIAGIVPVAGTTLLAARLLWEQTALTAKYGPQMVGFSLAHSAMGLLFVAPFVGAAWALATLAVVAMRKAWNERLPLAMLIWFVVCAAVSTVPYGTWQRLLVSTHAHGPHAGEFVSDAAATGDLKTLEAFLEQGVPVDVRNENNGATPRHGAAVEGQLEVIAYLLSKGANVNALNAYGDSPMENARSMNHPEAMRLLQAHGGAVIRGTDEQRDREIKREVDRDIHSMGEQP